MKKLLLFTAFLALSCSQDDDSQSNNSPVADCNCNRVVEANTFNVIGTPESPAISYYTVYTTINDCTGVQRQRNHTTTNTLAIPQVGQCR